MEDNRLFNDSIKQCYKNTRKTPVSLSYDSDAQELTIVANITFAKSLLKKYEDRPLNKKKKAPIVEETQTFADVVEEAIIKKWSGKYDMTPWGGPADLKVNVIVHRKDRGDVEPRQKTFRIQRVYGNGTSFVTSPLWRWFWGIFRGNKECFVTLNWSPLFPGTISLNKYRSKHTFQSTAAHEFGHILGLGDAYDAFYRFFYTAPGRASYMMRHNIKVAPEEVLMAMRSHSFGKMQYFPCEFDSQIVMNGIKESVCSKVARFKKK